MTFLLGWRLCGLRWRSGVKNIGLQCLLVRITLLEDVQASWLLLVHCASARVNCMTRVVEPATLDFSERNVEALWQCLCQIMRISPTQAEDIRLTASLPMVLGGFGLRSATRVRQAAYWSSWADCLPMAHQKHPVVAATLVVQLSGILRHVISRQCGRQNMSWQLQGLNHRRGRPLLVEPAPP